jgi:hypothetical protein
MLRKPIIFYITAIFSIRNSQAMAGGGQSIPNGVEGYNVWDKSTYAF